MLFGRRSVTYRVVLTLLAEHRNLLKKLWQSQLLNEK
jgi:hypothetical protein